MLSAVPSITCTETPSLHDFGYFPFSAAASLSEFTVRSCPMPPPPSASLYPQALPGPVANLSFFRAKCGQATGFGSLRLCPDPTGKQLRGQEVERSGNARFQRILAGEFSGQDWADQDKTAQSLMASVVGAAFWGSSAST